MVGEHSTASRKTQTFIFRTEVGTEVEVKRGIKRVERLLKNVGRVKDEEPGAVSLPAPSGEPMEKTGKGAYGQFIQSFRSRLPDL